MKQFVYRQKYNQPFNIPDASGIEFKLLTSPLDASWLFLPLIRCLGFSGLIKVGLKLVSSKRRLYCILADSCVAHYGWASFSFCRYYKVQVGDVVIGPILTVDRFCGRGYATVALMGVINTLMMQGYSVFWIDTSEDNISCRKVIEKCGFGKPVDSFERGAL